jgi:hypothetical protein
LHCFHYPTKFLQEFSQYLLPINVYLTTSWQKHTAGLFSLLWNIHPHSTLIRSYTMKWFFCSNASHHWKACTLVNRTTEANTVILFSFSIDGALNQIVHMLQKSNKLVDNTYHLKARNVTYRTTEFQIVLLLAYSKDRTTKKTMHAAKIYKLPCIYMKKTELKLDQIGG